LGCTPPSGLRNREIDMPTIPVIDDSLSALQAVERMLAEADCRARLCADGKSALEPIKSERIDLIRADIRMPEEGGLEVIRERCWIWRNAPVVAMSGITRKGSGLAVANQKGACRTLLKPFSDADLFDSIRAAPGAVLDQGTNQ
jgi:CheY-like chemotaxis protein